MATKKAKVETLFVVMGSDGCCFVNFDHEQQLNIEEVVFDKEKAAVDAATGALTSDVGNFDAEEILTVYKLVPVAKVKRAALVVEKL